MSYTTYVLYATVQTFIFFIQREKNNQEDSLNQRNLSSAGVAMHKFVWFKEICFESKKLFSGCRFVRIIVNTVSKANSNKIPSKEKKNWIRS